MRAEPGCNRLCAAGSGISENGRRMKLVSYNIRYGFGRDQQFDLRGIADSVSGADIIARNHGGDIRLEETEGGGLRARLILPL